MTDIPRIFRADPIPDNVVNILRLEGMMGSGVRAYPDRLARRFGGSQVAVGLSELARIVEPIDSALGVDPDLPVAKAVRAGAMIGLRVVSACVDDIDVSLSGIAFIPSGKGNDGSEISHVRYTFANEILDIGSHAYTSVKDTFEPLFAEWEHQLVPSVNNQHHLRRGFGIPIAYLSGLHERNQAADLATMEAQLANVEAGEEVINWDDLLAQ
jgi:hypothetical protein